MGGTSRPTHERSDYPALRDTPVTAARSNDPQDGGGLICPGCGGRNPRDAAECDWCGRPFVSQSHRLRVNGWQVASALLVVALVGAVAALALLNASRTVSPPRPPNTIPLVTSSPLPTAAVTAGAPAAPTPRPSASPAVARGTPTAAPATATVANTGGAGVTVRDAPGPQATAVGTLREGEVVNLTGEEQTVAARLWRQVEVPGRNLVGWVSAEYLATQP